MEELRIIAMICCIFVALFFVIGMIQALIEQIKLAKLRKKWAAEQEEARYQRKIKLLCCKDCKRKKNHTDYFGSECFYNSEWLCEGSAAPERPIIEAEASEDLVKVIRCRDCQFWKKEEWCMHHHMLVFNPDWYCASGMPKEEK